jgi:pimeloyl-ACP methyl ester carboxylesterase
MGEDVLQRLGAAMRTGGPEDVRRAMWEINLSPAFRSDESRYPAFLEMASTLSAPREVVMEQMRACAAHDTRTRLAGLSLPALVVHGTEDRLLPVSNGHQIAALLGVEPALLEGVGHMFWWEQPQRSAELIREHALAPA